MFKIQVMNIFAMCTNCPKTGQQMLEPGSTEPVLFPAKPAGHPPLQVDGHALQAWHTLLSTLGLAAPGKNNQWKQDKAIRGASLPLASCKVTMQIISFIC